MIRSRSAVLVSIAALLVCSSEAIGQVKVPPKDKKDKSSQKQPASNPNQTQPAPVTNRPDELVEPGPYIAREMPKEWTMRARVRLTAKAPGIDAQILSLPPSKQRSDNAVNAGNASGFVFQALTMVFPVAPSTAGADPVDDGIEGWLKVDDRKVATTARVAKKQSSGSSYPGGTRLVQFSTRTGSGDDEVPNGVAREVEMEIEVPMICYRTRFDEASALKVPWPKNDWPPVVKSVFQPQVFVETSYDGTPYDQTRLKELVKDWTHGDPKSVTPAMLAKEIAAAVVQNFQPSGDARSVLRTGELQGFSLNGLEQTLANNRCTEFDLTCLLTAAYRSAGLPARLIIGIETANVDKKNFLDNRTKQGQFRSWVEFALYDEANNTLNWVPVDIVKLRKQSSRAQPLDRTWKYFGTHDELNQIAPIALQFHPPTSVIAYTVPGFWGWMVTPNPPSTAYQALLFDSFRTAKRPADPNDKKNTGNKSK